MVETHAGEKQGIAVTQSRLQSKEPVAAWCGISSPYQYISAKSSCGSMCGSGVVQERFGFGLRCGLGFELLPGRQSAPWRLW